MATYDGMGEFRETELYAPVKAFLEGQGFAVKGEVADADVVACREDDPPVIVELKAGFSLTLLHQAVARLAVTDAVYVCVPRRGGRVAMRALKNNTRLCRRLGIGVMTVRLGDGLVCTATLAPTRRASPRHGAVRCCASSRGGRVIRHAAARRAAGR
ncbi:MAG: hypothetical protein AcusKO_06720 [Acuticoccus sp.]